MELNGGTISGNDGYDVYVGRGNFYMSGTAYAGEVYLPSDKVINVEGEFTAEGPHAVIEPETYASGQTVAVYADGITPDASDFSLTNEEYSLTADGQSLKLTTELEEYIVVSVTYGSETTEYSSLATTIANCPDGGIVTVLEDTQLASAGIRDKSIVITTGDNDVTVTKTPGSSGAMFTTLAKTAGGKTSTIEFRRGGGTLTLSGGGAENEFGAGIISIESAGGDDVEVYWRNAQQQPVADAFEPETAGETDELEVSAMSLWYDEPAATDSHVVWTNFTTSNEQEDPSHRVWEERALPIGNGAQGAIIFGGVVQERIQLNEMTLWRGKPEHNTSLWEEEHPGETVNMPESFTKSRELLEEARQKRIEADGTEDETAKAELLAESDALQQQALTEVKKLESQSHTYGGYTAFGNLTFDFTDIEKNTEYSDFIRGLDLDNSSEICHICRGYTTSCRRTVCSSLSICTKDPYTARMAP